MFIIIIILIVLGTQFPRAKEINANCKTLRVSRLVEKLGPQAPERMAEAN